MAIEDLQGLGRSHTLSNLVNGGAIWGDGKTGLGRKKNRFGGKEDEFHFYWWSFKCLVNI